jgi:hypothetical protein
MTETLAFFVHSVPYLAGVSVVSTLHLSLVENQNHSSLLVLPLKGLLTDL